MFTSRTSNLISATMTGLFLRSSHETIHNSYQLQEISNSSLQI